MARKENKLYLHIGEHKTGSTYIQSFLYENKDRLEKHRVIYPTFEYERETITAFKSPDYAKNGDFLFTKNFEIDSTSENFIAACNRIKKELEKGNVIISNEDFVKLNHLETVLKLLKKEIGNVCVILYLRRQDLLIESLWNQGVKGGSVSCSFNEYADHGWPDWLCLDYKKLIDIVVSVVGMDNTIVRIYEKEQLLENDLIVDFMHNIGINLSKKELDDWNKGLEVNNRVSGNYLEIKRIINSGNVVSTFPSFLWKDKITELSNYFNKDYEEHYFEGQNRILFLEEFKESNSYVARRCFDRNELFMNSKMNFTISMHDGFCDEAFLSDLIRMFSMMVGDLLNRVTALEEDKYRRVYEQISALSGNRKLYMWGAGNNCRQILQKCNWHVEGIVDSNVEKNGKYLMGRKIISFDVFDMWDASFFLVTPNVSDEIETILQSKGYKKDRDYVLLSEMKII